MEEWKERKEGGIEELVLEPFGKQCHSELAKNLVNFLAKEWMNGQE